MKRTTAHRICKHCNKGYFSNAMFYCSKSCRAKNTGVGHGVKTGKFVKCATCFKEIWRKGYLLKKYKELYCSRKCKGIKNVEKINKKYEGQSRTWMLGKNNWAWKDGITPVNVAIRGSLEYAKWRKSVFERDNYICIWCGQRGGNLHADHIKSFAEFPEFRFNINNGRTLCVDCHKKTETYGWNGYWQTKRNQSFGLNIG